MLSKQTKTKEDSQNSDYDPYIDTKIPVKTKKRTSPPVIASKRKFCPSPEFKNGFWELQEEFKFKEFILANRDIFQFRPSRREYYAFRAMAEFIDTRSPKQCRSHYQKYELRYGTFESILEYLSSKLQRWMKKQQKLGVPQNFDKIQLCSKVPKAKMEENWQQECLKEESNHRTSQKLSSVIVKKQQKDKIKTEAVEGCEILIAKKQCLQIKVVLDLNTFF